MTASTLSEVTERDGTLTVTGNWRITFEVIDDEVCDMDLEDYH